MKGTRHILPLIILSQFAGTSLWFAGNAVVKDIVLHFGLETDVVSTITTAVQLGFITGSLLFAIFTIADRFSPSRIFFASALAGAISNLCILGAHTLTGVVFSRFATGFFLAGIYPVGMKIATDYHDKGLGKALGYLVGALVLGTAFPHLLNGLKASYNWHYVIVSVSVIASIGGLLILLFVPDGPYRTRITHPDFSLAFSLFRNKPFRAAALGYFGHMWELYTFWALVPAMLSYYFANHGYIDTNISLWSFFIIASGSIACVIGGYISFKKGSARTAFGALLMSFLCCATAFFFLQFPVYVFIPVMIIWGMTVVADSPQFTTTGAQLIEPANRGTAITFVNAIGFFITIVSIQTITALRSVVGETHVYFILALGPLTGLFAMKRLLKK
ncbi:MAG: MFS transporter [Bacteroidetes bacterium]|nr:MFS transporter [Bacteroidota bacterium]